MSNFGFVYILTNEYMPDVYKVGCTERSPHTRAEELSKSTGVPAPFRVLCYIEVDDFQAVEKRIHGWLKEYRISESREFFHKGLLLAVRILYWLRGRKTFAIPSDTAQFPADWELCDVFGSDYSAMSETVDPWTPPPPAPPPSAEEAVAHVVNEAVAAAAAVSQDEVVD